MNNNIKINMPKWVEYIINTLQENDFEAYIVGGCVRDSLLKREPKDWDVTTNAKPEEVIEIFESLGYKIIPTGLKHDTVTIVIEKEQFEVTTYRIDSEYSDGRHPDNVEFTNSLKEDLSRRDFTINAMAYNNKEGLIDYFGGYKDLQFEIIRCVGNPKQRFNEDALRIMRAYRFASQLKDFDIADDTLDATIELRDNLKNISIERIRDEFNKILIADCSILFGMFNYGILDSIIPELFVDCKFIEQNNSYHIYDVFNHLVHSTKEIESKLHLKLTMLFHDMAKPQCKTTDSEGIDHFYGHAEMSSKIAERVLRILRYDNETINKITMLIKYHDTRINSNKSIRKLLNKIGEENLRDLIKVWIADIKAQNPVYLEDRLKEINETVIKLDEIIEKQQCFQMKDLKINGRDLMQLGIKEGKEIGVILNRLLEIVLENPELNVKEKLLSMV